MNGASKGEGRSARVCARMEQALLTIQSDASSGKNRGVLETTFSRGRAFRVDAVFPPSTAAGIVPHS